MPPSTEVVLTDEGIQAGGTWVYFGMREEETMEAVTAVLGDPEADSGWIDALSSPFGVCPPPLVRVVEWGGFSLYFTQADSDFWLGGVRHFFSYEYVGAPPEFATDRGIRIGSTVAELEAAYGGPRFELIESPLDPAVGFWSYDLAEWTGMWGFTTGTDPSEIVVSINGGRGCGE